MRSVILLKHQTLNMRCSGGRSDTCKRAVPFRGDSSFSLNVGNNPTVMICLLNNLVRPATSRLTHPQDPAVWRCIGCVCVTYQKVTALTCKCTFLVEHFVPWTCVSAVYRASTPWKMIIKIYSHNMINPCAVIMDPWLIFYCPAAAPSLLHHYCCLKSDLFPASTPAKHLYRKVLQPLGWSQVDFNVLESLRGFTSHLNPHKSKVI